MRVGVMEWWSNGVMGAAAISSSLSLSSSYRGRELINPIIQSTLSVPHSITSLLHYSITPPLAYPTTPSLHHSISR